jgi:hypothetical protein
VTLTSLLPTLRESIPTPFDAAAWPARSVPSTDDVTVAAVSLRRYAELCGTPCVCTGPAIIPLSGGAASPTDSTTVVLMRVTAADAGGIRVDARLSALHPVWREARLLGRVSHAYDEPFAVYGGDSEEATASVVLPGDPRPGDLIAVPCAGCHSVGEVRCARAEA